MSYVALTVLPDPPRIAKVDGMREVSLFVGIASGRDARWPFPQRLAALAGMFQGRITVEASLGFATCQARHKLVQRARDVGASHILFLDDDNTFPFNAADRLLAHGKRIIAANYTTRSTPVCPTAMKNGERVQSRGRSGIERVDFAATGVMLIDLTVFDEISKPYFETPYMPGVDDYMSDDVFFCKKAAAAGIETWVDHDLSQEVGHIGAVVFNHTMVPEREPDDPLVLAKELLGWP